MNEREIPPIASPQVGKWPASHPRPKEEGACVRASLRLAAVFRYAAFEWLTPLTLGLLVVAPTFGALALFPIEVRRLGWLALPAVFVVLLVALLLFSFPIALLIRLCSKRHFEICLTPTGLWKRYLKRNIFFPWSKIVWVLERNGDVWLASLSEGCFIPREAFASRDEAREFASIARQIKQGVWRDEWNGRVFGVHDERSKPR